MADDKSDKINPTAKLPPAAATAAVNGAVKPQPLNAPRARPMYRPKPPSRRRRNNRGCFCCCCLWITFLVITLLLLLALVGAVFWLIYRPQRPDFTVDSLQLSQLSIAGAGTAALTSKFSLALSARNPNSRVAFLYDPITVSVFSGDAAIGSGSLPGFKHVAKNTTSLKTNVAASGETLGADQISTMKSAIKSKSHFPVKITLDTNVKVKAGGLKTKKVSIQVTCDDISVTAPTKKSPSKATVPNQKCKVDLRIKIWKWNF